MKKAIVVLLTVCLLISAAGCSALENAFTPTETVFTVKDYHLQITADSTFQDKTTSSHDLQIFNGKAYISVLAYKYIDLPEDITPLDVYEIQNEDLFSKRTAVKVLEEAATQTLETGITITQGLYSAERDGNKNYYGAYLVDLPQAETLAWVLISSTPSYFENNREYLQDIVFSMTTTQ